MFKSYEKLLNEVLDQVDYVPGEGAMKVGLIGLGRMGEGMSRRMIKAGIEVHGYRNNVLKLKSNMKRVISVDIPLLWKSLVQVVHNGAGVFTDTARSPGVFMMVVPAETVEDTLNELLQFCVEGDIIIDHGNSNFKDSRRRADRLSKLGMSYLDCGTSGGVYGLERGYCLMVGGANFAVSVCSPIFRALAPGIGLNASRTDPFSYETSAEHGFPLWTSRCWSLREDGSQWNRIRNYASICRRI